MPFILIKQYLDLLVGMRLAVYIRRSDPHLLDLDILLCEQLPICHFPTKMIGLLIFF